MKKYLDIFWPVATILLVMYIVHLKSKVPPDNTVLKQIIAQDSIKMADLQQSVSNLLGQVEARESELDSLKTVQKKLNKTYINEINSIRFLPMSERLRLHNEYLNEPDTILFE